MRANDDGRGFVSACYMIDAHQGDHRRFRCDLCWTNFATYDELAQHKADQEQDCKTVRRNKGQGHDRCGQGADRQDDSTRM